MCEHAKGNEGKVLSPLENALPGPEGLAWPLLTAALQYAMACKPDCHDHVKVRLVHLLVASCKQMACHAISLKVGDFMPCVRLTGPQPHVH